MNFARWIHRPGAGKSSRTRADPPFWRILGPQLRSWKAAQKGGSGSRWSVRPIAQAGDLAGDALLLPDCLDVVERQRIASNGSGLGGGASLRGGDAGQAAVVLL